MMRLKARCGSVFKLVVGLLELVMWLFIGVFTISFAIAIFLTIFLVFG